MTHASVINNALIQLPALQPDELLAGWYWRFGLISGFSSRRATARWLIGQSEIIPPWFLPHRINRLAKRLMSIDPIDLINRHTMLPLFGLFFGSRDYWDLVEIMRGDAITQSCHSRIGLLRNNGGPEVVLAHCDECVAHDLLTLGFAYYRRSHQVPGVTVCYLHKSILKTGCGKCSFTAGRQRAFALPSFTCLCGADCRTVTRSPMSDADMDEHFRISMLANTLLNLPPAPIEFPDLRRCYMARAHELGYFTGQQLNQKALTEFLYKRYSYDLLQRFGANVGAQVTWFRRMFAKDRPPKNPIHHLLTINLLFDNIQQFTSILDTSRTWFPPKGASTSSVTASFIRRLKALRLDIDPADNPTALLPKLWPYNPKSRKERAIRAERDAFFMSLLYGRNVVDLARCGTRSTKVYLSWLYRVAESHERWRRAYLALMWHVHYTKLRDICARYPMATLEEIQHRAARSSEIVRYINTTHFERLVKRKAHFNLGSVIANPGYNTLKDHNLARSIRIQAKAMRSTHGRPTRITRTRLATSVKGAKSISSGNGTYRAALTALRECTETHEEYERRLIIWALKEYRVDNAKSAIHHVARVLWTSLDGARRALQRHNLDRNIHDAVG